MPHATKGVAAEAAATKRAGKRSRDASDEGHAVKRPRIENKQGRFRFLELPAELRNRVYELAYGITYRTFPTTSFRKEQMRKSRQARSQSPPCVIASIGKDWPIPFSGLVQSCSLIRTEFRGWWMGAHRIPLCACDRYLSAFFPSPPSNEQDRKRFKSFFNGAGRLRIFLRREELKNRDFIRLVRHKMRFPHFTIKFEHLAEVTASEAKGLEALVNNKHPAWMRWVRTNALSQIRVCTLEGGIHIVMKEKDAALWMRPALHINIPDGYLATVGLDVVSGWILTFGVDYS